MQIGIIDDFRDLVLPPVVPRLMGGSQIGALAANYSFIGIAARGNGVWVEHVVNGDLNDKGLLMTSGTLLGTARNVRLPFVNSPDVTGALQTSELIDGHGVAITGLTGMYRVASQGVTNECNLYVPPGHELVLCTLAVNQAANAWLSWREIPVSQEDRG